MYKFCFHSRTGLRNGVTEFATSLIRFFSAFFRAQNRTGFYSVETDEIGRFLCLSAGSCLKSRCFGVGAALRRSVEVDRDLCRLRISFAWYSSSLFACSLELDIKTDFAKCAMLQVVRIYPYTTAPAKHKRSLGLLLHAFSLLPFVYTLPPLNLSGPRPLLSSPLHLPLPFLHL